MESIIIHPKNPMELKAVKSTLREMGIKFEKANTQHHKKDPKVEQKIWAKKVAKDFKIKPKSDL